MILKVRIPATPRPSTAKALKAQWRRARKVAGSTVTSLKPFARTVEATDWFFNKSANFAKPPLGLGRTSKGKGGKKKGSS